MRVNSLVKHDGTLLNMQVLGCRHARPALQTQAATADPPFPPASRPWRAASRRPTRPRQLPTPRLGRDHAGASAASLRQGLCPIMACIQHSCRRRSARGAPRPQPPRGPHAGQPASDRRPQPAPRWGPCTQARRMRLLNHLGARLPPALQARQPRKLRRRK